MKTDIWMPIVIGDYLKDTRHLSTVEHGSYFLILMEMWVKNGWIPLKTLNRIALQEKNLWVSEIWPNLKELFIVKDELVSQSRLLAELEKSHKNRKTASENGKLGGRPKKIKTQKKPMGKPIGEPSDNPDHNPDHNPEKTSSPSPNKRNIKEKNSKFVNRVISYLNAKTGKKFNPKTKPTIKSINARLDDGFKPDDFKKVIDNKVQEWGADPDMVKYLRPETLFRPSHFESYLNQSAIQPKEKVFNE